MVKLLLRVNASQFSYTAVICAKIEDRINILFLQNVCL